VAAGVREIIEAIYERWNAGDVEGSLEHCDPEDE
jgi:hypothetical protein